MNPSSGRYRGKPTAEPIMGKKAFGELPSLQELLPKATLQLASSLSDNDKEVLAYLIEYGRRAILAESASPACRSPWKNWKLASMVSRREQVPSPCPFSRSCREAPVLGEEVELKRSSWLLADKKPCSTCDCFSCYSIFWSRWNGSASRDLINEILDIEEGPKNSKVKKKKRADKKRAALGAEEFGKLKGPDGSLDQATGQIMNKEGTTDMQTFNNTSWTALAPASIDEGCVVQTNAMDGISHAGTMAEEVPKIATQTLRSGRKKSMFRVSKQKEEAGGPNLKSRDSRSNKVPAAIGLDEEGVVASGLIGDLANRTEAAYLSEVSGNVTPEATEVMAASLSPASLSAKNPSRLPRIAKRRHSQVIPLDCEGLSDIEREQEAATTVESAQAPMSPRAADIGLGGRGFLARVFPDALGRVASRLWDLVSVRLRSRTVEYN